jgi:hypothetical protein
LKINQPSIDPLTGEVVFHNDITESEADFVVDEQDYRETVRMATAEMLMDMIAKMPPEVGLKMLDLALDLTDIPNRAEFVARVRKINGEAAADQPPTPEQIAQQQQAQADAQKQRDLADQTAQAKIARDQAAANKSNADAAAKGVETKGKALGLAHAVAAAPVFAPAADAIADAPLPPGITQMPRPPLLGPPPQPNGVFLPNPPAPAQQ